MRHAGVLRCLILAAATLSAAAHRHRPKIAGEAPLQGALSATLALPTTAEPADAPATPQRPNAFLVSTGRRIKEVAHAWLDALQAGAVVTTVCLQLSPLRSVLEILQSRDVKRYDGYPYFTVLAGASQWCIYGAVAAGFSGNNAFFTMVEANGPGIVFGIFYCTVFLRYVPEGEPRGKALHNYLKLGALLVAMELSCIATFRGQAVFWLGLLGAIGSAQIALSPFKTLPEVLRTQSTRSWPIDLVWWSFIQSFATGSFGLAAGDPWVLVPNIVGVIAAGFQLLLVAVFYEVPPKGKAAGEKVPRLPGTYGTTTA